MNKITIVTGGSRGIGQATVKMLASEGHQICVGYNSSEEQANLLVEEIRFSGGHAIAVKVDISEEEQVMELFSRVDKELGLVTGLVNNAAILLPQSSFYELNARRINKILSTNTTGSFLCAREAIKRMAQKNGGMGGSIVNVSSVASRLGSPGEYVDYAASKGALDTMTVGLSLEVANQGIRVNGVRPGFIYTDIHKDGGEPGRVDRVKSMLPMQRGGQPEEVAEAICWLLSEKASYVTGSFIDLAGGK
ncbi:MAG TPA: SDR family oxidoreductase [Noviherbaspirillum sp.]|uniref:SDR family oxidoreductase n=1 Tax=Noviherbaspirillum sp. TaxID=1926288 RepID=UPI002B478197|nr:SDR family oxidoreductase [Noviherbaspirillum sp.]HJV86510.1 SDR family oxidoreductase [Noviherbaspirillum sp.]